MCLAWLTSMKRADKYSSTHQPIRGQRFKPRPVMEALAEAMEVLFVLTELHDESFNLFLKFSEGNSRWKKNRC